MLREIIEIDEELCAGCANCVPNCHQGALQIIDGKARLISELMCEGIGVCVGHCPTGAMARSFSGAAPAGNPGSTVPAASELRQWPVQLHLLNPAARYFQGADVLLAADCTAFAMGGFHQKLLKGKTVAIACPKLDQGKDAYIEKLTQMIDDAGINTLTVAMMQVPCCGGLLQIAQAAVAQAQRPIPIKKLIVSLEGETIDEGWVM
ncbi:MAG: 4Fe-4S ferredoxin [Spirochaetaceae bacterium]|nr:MAG: 4Fe-4S ferredoxin [Spirochaetaceae bacterium]